MAQPIIEVENLSKCYRIGALREPYLSLRDEIVKFASRLGSKSTGRAGKDFWALNDVSFSVRQGEAVGIIGRNGAGKSTLLKILSQITPPTRGQITMRGRVASLLEVGTGFHPELTGRENIFLNGAIMGMTRSEIKRKFDQIVAFAEVEEFLDTPVKRYSSGMYVRLAFAVAAHMEPEIMVVDEVLAVGDARFQQKCLGKMGDVAKQGRTVLFVSHNMGAIRSLCETAIWLDNGRIVKGGAVNDILREYEETMTGLFSASSLVAERDPADIKGSALHVSRVEIVNAAGKPAARFIYGETLVLNVSLGGQLAGEVFSAEFYIYNELGLLVAVGASGAYHGEYFSGKVRNVRIEIGPLTITSGRYRISLSLVAVCDRVDTWDNAIAFTITECQPFRANWEMPAFREGVCVLQQSFQATTEGLT